MLTNYITIGKISMGVAWLLGSAAIFIFKTTKDGIIYFTLGFVALLILIVIEHRYEEHMKEKGLR